MEALSKIIKTLPKADYVEEILMPGEKRDAIYRERLKNGYLVPLKVWNKVVETAKKYNVPIPDVC